jgi:hypothetical protein
MTRTEIWFLALAGCATVGLSSFAVTRSAPSPRFDTIPARNLFRLVSPPVLRAPTPLLAKVRLAGVTTILDAPRALLKIQFPATASSPATEQSWILRQGECYREIELVEIDVAAPRIKINSAGAVQVISFDSDPPEPPGPPLSPPMPPGLPSSNTRTL